MEDPKVAPVSHLLLLSLGLVFLVRKVGKPASAAFRFFDMFSELGRDRTDLRGRRCRRGGEEGAS